MKIPSQTFTDNSINTCNKLTEDVQAKYPDRNINDVWFNAANERWQISYNDHQLDQEYPDLFSLLYSLEDGYNIEAMPDLVELLQYSLELFTKMLPEMKEIDTDGKHIIQLEINILEIEVALKNAKHDV